MKEILTEWDDFARTLFPANLKVTGYALRHHAHEILLELMRDMDAPHCAQQQTDKSKGNVSRDYQIESAADIHGTLRHDSGFTLTQVAAEFQALRATVLSLWLPKIRVMTSDIAIDLVRFNDAIDRALAESLVTYSRSVLKIC